MALADAHAARVAVLTGVVGGCLDSMAPHSLAPSLPPVPAAAVVPLCRIRQLEDASQDALALALLVRRRPAGPQPISPLFASGSSVAGLPPPPAPTPTVWTNRLAMPIEAALGRSGAWGGLGSGLGGWGGPGAALRATGPQELLNTGGACLHPLSSVVLSGGAVAARPLSAAEAREGGGVGETAARWALPRLPAHEIAAGAARRRGSRA